MTEDDGEAGDVGDPAEFTDDGDENGWTAVLEFFEDVSCCLEDEAEGCDND